jgi:hypothetical protein
MLQTIQGWNWAAIFAALFAISEALGAVPAIKSNGVFQFVFGILKSLAPKSDAQAK